MAWMDTAAATLGTEIRRTEWFAGDLAAVGASAASLLGLAGLGLTSDPKVPRSDLEVAGQWALTAVFVGSCVVLARKALGELADAEAEADRLVAEARLHGVAPW
jgi:hypothetical protein